MLLEAAGLYAGAKFLDNAIQYYTNRNSQDQAQANTEKNMQMSQGLSDVSWYNRIVKYPDALRDAGLSPALAAAGQSQGSANVTASPSPMPQVTPTPGFIDFENQMEMNKSQTALNEAAAKKANEEARKTRIQNDREEHVDKDIDTALSTMLSEMRDNTDNPFMRGFLDTYLDSTDDRLNLGDYEAFNKMWFDFSQRERDRELDFIQKEFDKHVLQMQYENGAAAALAEMPKAKRFEVYAAVNQMNANVARLNAETSLTEDQRDKLRAETSKLGQEVMSIFHSDPAAMYKAGDISALLVGLGYDAVKAVAAGAGFGAGAAVTRGAGAGASAARSMSSIGSRSLSVPKSNSVMPSEVFSRIKASAARHANGDKVYEAQLINGAVKRWHEQHK